MNRDVLLCAENRATRRFRKLGQNPLVREGAPLLGLYWLYSFVRWVVAYDSPYEAFANAFRIIQLEKQLGIFYEPLIQGGLIDHALGVVHFANWFYTFGYFPVLLLAGVLLYRFDRGRFHTFKLTFSLGLGFALLGYSLFPLAPPRMLPEVGFVDTQQVYGLDLCNHKFVVSLYNPHAAMPSMHFGFALLVGMMACTFDRRTLKAVGVLYPCCMALVIVTSGHHYILDIVGGSVVIALAYILVRVLSRAKSAPMPVVAGIHAAGPYGENKARRHIDGVGGRRYTES